jgi:hypothetical protein
MVGKNAPGVGIRVVLLQKGYPIAYISKLFGIMQQTFFTYERKMMVILLAINK